MKLFKNIDGTLWELFVFECLCVIIQKSKKKK